MNLFVRSDIDAPYPGLRPFRQEESVIFFGRDEQIDEVLERLKNHRFLGIVGLSGCGKSSLIRAGILPALESGLMGELGANWYIADMKPGNAPLANLAGALIDSGALDKVWSDSAQERAMLSASLRRSDRALVNLVSQIQLPPFSNLLILVDQFEEIFRFEQQDADEALAFVNLLLTTCKDRSVPIYVVITMRSDFLGQCVRFPALPDTLNDSLYLCPSPTRSQLADAISKPAELFGGHIEESLVNKIINDVRASPDMLPLIQHLLGRMWYAAGGSKKVPAPILRLKDYRKVGGLNGVSPLDSVSFTPIMSLDQTRSTSSGNSGTHRSLTAIADVFHNALSEHADEAYFELCDQTSASRERGTNHKPSRQQKIAELVFRCLAERGPSGQYVRRPAKIRDIASVAACSPDEVRAVIEVFRRDDRSFLLPATPTPLDDDTTIDIIHEALIRQWQRFGGTKERPNDPDAANPWLVEEEVCRHRYRRLAEAAENEPFAGLLHDPELSFLNAWWQSFRPTPAWAQLCSRGSHEQISDFLQRSLDQDTAIKSQQAAEHRSRVDQAESINRHLKRRLKLIVMCGILVLILAVIATLLAIYAQQQSRMTIKALSDARVNATLAIDARSQAERLAYAGTLASAQSEWESKRARQAWDLLDSAQWDLRGWEHDYLFTLFNQGHRTIVDSSNIHCIAISTDGMQMFTGGDDSLIKVWNISDLKSSVAQQSSDNKHKGQITCLCISPDEDRLLSGSSDGTINVWRKDSLAFERSLTSTGAVQCVAFSHDGKEIISGGSDNKIRIWSVESWKELISFDGHTGTVNCVAVSPDGRYIVSGSADGTIRKWERGNRTFQLLPNNPQEKLAEVSCLAITHDSRRIVSGHKDGNLKIWPFDGDHAPWVAKAHARNIRGLAMTKDDTGLVTCGDDHIVKFWDITDTAHTMERRTCVGHTREVNCVAINPKNGDIVSGGSDHQIKIWYKNDQAYQERPTTTSLDERTRTEAGTIKHANGYGAKVSGDSIELKSPTGNLRKLTGHDRKVNCLAFNQDGSRLASGGEDETVILWDVLGGKELCKLKGHASFVACVAFSPDGNRIFTGGDDNVVKVWDITTSDSTKLRGHETITLRGHTDTVDLLEINNDNQEILSSSKDGTTKRWSATEKQKTRTIKAHTAAVTNVAITRDGKQIASASHDNTVKLWNSSTGQEIRSFRDHENRIKCIAMSPDGTLVANGSNDGTIAIWDAKTGERLHGFSRDTGAVNSIAFSPDGQELFSDSTDGPIDVWNIKSAKLEVQLTDLENPSKAVRCLAVDRNGQRIASGSDDGTVRLWDMSGRRLLKRFKPDLHKINSIAFGTDALYFASDDDDARIIYKWNPQTDDDSTIKSGHRDSITSLAVSPDGKFLVSTSKDSSVKVWDATSGEVMRSYNGHLNSVTTAVFSPDNLITGSEDKTIKFWELPTSGN